MTVRERILLYLEYKSISKYRFYKETGISNGFLDKEGAIGTDKCVNICSQYPDINPEWLLMGSGSMIKSVENKENSKLKSSSTTSDDTAIKQLINKIVELIAENENLKTVIGELNGTKSYSIGSDLNNSMVAEDNNEYKKKQNLISLFNENDRKRYSKK